MNLSYIPCKIKELGTSIKYGLTGIGLIALVACGSPNPDFLAKDYSCGKTFSSVENVRVYNFTTDFLLNRENYNTIADIARKYGLTILWGGGNNVGFFNSPEEDGLVRSTVIPTGVVDSALEEICDAIRR